MRQIWVNARVILPGQPATPQPVDILTEGGLIAAVGRDLPRDGARVVDCGGRMLTPGLIDCHTHLVFGGDRSREFELRLDGASYAQIAAEGGGIAATMRATRAADGAALTASALARLDRLIAEGVTTVEIKSGYGLTIADEMRMLRVARDLARLRPVRVVTSWLAAHALPPEYQGRHDAYIAEVAIAGLEQAHAAGLVDAVDGFCESVAFSADQLRPLFARARALGLPVKLHAEQMSQSGGIALATAHGALSCDHLEHATAADAALMAAAGTVAVLLPGAYYMLRETLAPPVAALRDAGVPMALSTDCNPGTSPLTSALLTLNMGAVLFRMTVGECIAGMTGNAARALGLAQVTGAIAPGLTADFAIWDVDRPAQLVGRLGFNPLHARVFNGEFTA